MEDLEKELQEEVVKKKAAHKAWQERNYKLARELGFSGYESAVLQNWGESKIRSLAESRKLSPLNNPPSKKER